MCKTAVKASKLCNASIFPPALSTGSHQLESFYQPLCSWVWARCGWGFLIFEACFLFLRPPPMQPLPTLELLQAFSTETMLPVVLNNFPISLHSTRLHLPALHSHANSSSSNNQFSAFGCFIRNLLFPEIFPLHFYTAKSPMNPVFPHYLLFC